MCLAVVDKGVLIIFIPIMENDSADSHRNCEELKQKREQRWRGDGGYTNETGWMRGDNREVSNKPEAVEQENKETDAELFWLPLFLRT